VFPRNSPHSASRSLRGHATSVDPGPIWSRRPDWVAAGIDDIHTDGHATNRRELLLLIAAEEPTSSGRSDPPTFGIGVAPTSDIPTPRDDLRTNTQSPAPVRTSGGASPIASLRRMGRNVTGRLWGPHRVSGAGRTATGSPRRRGSPPLMSCWTRWSSSTGRRSPLFRTT
jgi:hypothetical protein